MAVRPGAAKKVDLIHFFTAEVEIDSETLKFLVIRDDDVIVIQVKTPKLPPKPMNEQN